LRKWCDDLRRGDHVVHIYKSADEQAKALLDLIGWMREDEKLVLHCDGPDREGGDCFALNSQMFEAAAQDGRMEVLPSYRAVCPTGKFRADALPDLLIYDLGRTMDEGFSGAVLCIDYSWIAELPEDFASHVVQSSQITLARLPSNLTLLCQYDQRRLTAEQADQLLRVHQLALADGKLARNFWVVATSTLGGRGRSIKAMPQPSAAATGQEK
jgi:hypothetical protein